MSDAILSVDVLAERWMRLLRVRAQTQGGEIERLFVEHPDGAQILAYDPERRVAMTGVQMRLGALFRAAEPIVEALGGAVEHGDPEASARLEALEEGGIRLGALDHVGSVWMTPSSTTERVYLYLGAYSPGDCIGDGGGLADEGEHIAVQERPLAELWESAQSGAMTDAKLYMLLHALHLRRPDLFA